MMYVRLAAYFSFPFQPLYFDGMNSYPQAGVVVFTV